MNHLRVGIPLIGGKGWVGGAFFIELHVKAVTALAPQERPQLYLIVDAESIKRLECYKSFLHLFDGYIYVGERSNFAEEKLESSVIYCKNYDQLFYRVDFYFPVNFNVLEGRPAASWIHDFQHKHLPSLFSNNDIKIRDALCQKVAAQSRLVFCTSKAVEQDFHNFYPQSQAITKVLSLRVCPEEDWYLSDPLAVQRKYGLPDRFVLCSNQFWIHKNHKLLLEAVALLRKSGRDIHLVCTGETSDFRRADYFGTIQKLIIDLGIEDLVYIVGMIPRYDQIQLLRRSMFVVQPSLFEGLGLIVQECQALGKCILLSNLDVHMEHDYGLYFDRHSAEDLAAKIELLLPIAEAGPDVRREREAKLVAYEMAQDYGRQFCQMVEEAQCIFSKQVIAVATSINRNGDISNQRRAIDSWLDQGLRVYSVNNHEDIEVLKPSFPMVSFYALPRSARASGVRVSVHDLVNCLEGTQASICGILCSDIYLFSDRLYTMILKETAGSVVIGNREEIESVSAEPQQRRREVGYMFFDRACLTLGDAELFFDGSWWDVWLILVALSRKYTIKRFQYPAAYHINNAGSSGLVDHYHYLLWCVIDKHTREIN